MCRTARVLFDDSQEWHFQGAKRSDKSSTILQEGRLAHAQELRFHCAKRSNIGSAVQQLS